MSEREPWDQYFMSMAEHAASRSTCTRRKVGAVAVNNRNRVIGTGYNGAPSGLEHCTTETCVRRKLDIPSGTQLDLCKAIHAEANIVLQLGDRLKGAKVYCTTQPCTSCLKLLMGASVSEIFWKEFYPDPYSTELMLEYGIPSIRNGLVNLYRRSSNVTQNCRFVPVDEVLAFLKYSLERGYNATPFIKPLVPVWASFAISKSELASLEEMRAFIAENSTD